MGMDEVDPEALARESLLLVIAATCRDGDVPGNGRAFMDWLKARDAGTLPGLRFAVLGIGNRIYPSFCAAAAGYDAALEAAGAERLAGLELADEIAGQADTVKQWLELFAKLWSADGAAPKQRRAIVELIPPARPQAVDPATLGTVALNMEMLGNGAGPDRSTRLIAVDLPAQAPDYVAGDHLAVYPVNPEALVEGLCRHLGLPPEAWFRVLGTASPVLERFRDGYPLRRLLSEDLDLALPEALEELFAAMRAVSRDLDDQAQLDHWLDVLGRTDADPGRRQLRGWLRDAYITLVDLFDAFPQSVPGLETLIELMPRMKPRYYSIGSSPRVYPRQVRIMAGALSVPLPDGRVRRGLCSHHLRDLEAGATLRLALKPAPRRLPDGFAGPLLLVGAGTGLAPLYGIIEDRVARGVTQGAENPALLYFGCRSPEEFLERRALTDWRMRGALSRLSVAFSRQGPVKAYVQDALDADGGTVWDVLRKPEAHFLICGDAKMAQDVEERLLQILRREAGIEYAEAHRSLQAMRREGRYIEDVWGVQLNHDVAMPEVVRSKYDRGATWLSRLQRALTGRRPPGGAILQL
jgi:sulfite reductase alpha subunit-like flavoprotein